MELRDRLLERVDAGDGLALGKYDVRRALTGTGIRGRGVEIALVAA